MQGQDGKLQSGVLEGFRVLKLIPLVIRYAAGAPSIVQNPTNEAITLTDTGTGDVLVTLTNGGVAPLIVVGMNILPADATTLGLLANLKAAPTRTAFSVYVNSGADGATETDPVDIHLLIVKQEQSA